MRMTGSRRTNLQLIFWMQTLFEKVLHRLNHTPNSSKEGTWINSTCDDMHGMGANATTRRDWDNDSNISHESKQYCTSTPKLNPKHFLESYLDR